MSLELLYTLDGEDPLLGGVGDIVIDEGGGLFLTDYQQRRAFAYDADGTFLRAYGKPGEGPGEFNVIVAVAVSSDSVYAFDNRVHRLSVFNKEDASFARSVVLKVDDWTPFRLLAVTDDEIIALFSPPVSFADAEFASENYEVRALPLGGKESRAIWETPRVSFVPIEVNGIRMLRVMPLSADSHCDILLNVGYCGFTTDVAISSFSLAGDSLTTISIDAPRRNISDPERDAILAGFENPELRKQIVVPEVHPAFSHFVVDDRGRLWIRREGSTESGTTYWVVDPDASSVIAVSLEGSATVYDVRDGRVAALIRQSDGSRPVAVFSAP